MLVCSRALPLSLSADNSSPSRGVGRYIENKFVHGRIWHNGFMLRVKRLSPNAVVPTVAHPREDIGYDLYSCEDLTIAPRSGMGVRTGIAIEFVPPAGGIVKTRSSLARKRLMCNGGVIDAGYRGEIVVLIENLGEAPYQIRKGDKVAQLLEHPFLASEVVESDLSSAARGSKGFGSSGE